MVLFRHLMVALLLLAVTEIGEVQLNFSTNQEKFHSYFKILYSNETVGKTEKEPFATQWQVKGETAEFEQYDDFSAVEVGGFVWSFGEFLDVVLNKCKAKRRIVNQFFSGGSKLSKKSGSSVYKMNNSFVWERHPQQMAFSRSGHRVVKDGKNLSSLRRCHCLNC